TYDLIPINEEEEERDEKRLKDERFIVKQQIIDELHIFDTAVATGEPCSFYTDIQADILDAILGFVSSYKDGKLVKQAKKKADDRKKEKDDKGLSDKVLEADERANENTPFLFTYDKLDHILVGDEQLEIEGEDQLDKDKIEEAKEQHHLLRVREIIRAGEKLQSPAVFFYSLSILLHVTEEKPQEKEQVKPKLSQKDIKDNKEKEIKDKETKARKDKVNKEVRKIVFDSLKRSLWLESFELSELVGLLRSSYGEKPAGQFAGDSKGLYAFLLKDQDKARKPIAGHYGSLVSPLLSEVLFYTRLYSLLEQEKDEQKERERQIKDQIEKDRKRKEKERKKSNKTTAKTGQTKPDKLKDVQEDEQKEQEIINSFKEKEKDVENHSLASALQRQIDLIKYKKFADLVKERKLQKTKDKKVKKETPIKQYAIPEFEQEKGHWTKLFAESYYTYLLETKLSKSNITAEIAYIKEREQINEESGDKELNNEDEQKEENDPLGQTLNSLTKEFIGKQSVISRSTSVTKGSSNQVLKSKSPNAEKLLDEAVDEKLRDKAIRSVILQYFRPFLQERLSDSFIQSGINLIKAYTQTSPLRPSGDIDIKQDKKTKKGQSADSQGEAVFLPGLNFGTLITTLSLSRVDSPLALMILSISTPKLKRVCVQGVSWINAPGVVRLARICAEIEV
ncbi:MAG: hypothetical protein EZS28_008502, partial [Streblomastix strix]